MGMLDSAFLEKPAITAVPGMQDGCAEKPTRRFGFDFGFGHLTGNSFGTGAINQTTIQRGIIFGFAPFLPYLRLISGNTVAYSLT